MKTAPRKKSEPAAPKSDAAVILYKKQTIDIFEHADFCRRWFKVVNMRAMPNAHSNLLTSSTGERFVFRTAKFSNFDKVEPGKWLTIVQCLDTQEVWILTPGWIRGLATFDPKTKQIKILIPQPVTNYRKVLDFLKLFYGDGETMKRLINKGRIVEEYL